MIRVLKYLGPFIMVGLLFSLVACGGDDGLSSNPSANKTATLYAFSNSSPNITEIDAETNSILRTADIPGLVKLAWNDDGNFFDGTDLWVTARNPEAKTSELIFLNLETLAVSGRLALGSNPANVYLGVGNLHTTMRGDGATQEGQVFVGLQGNMDQSGEVVVVDAKTRKIIDRLAVNQIACDIDTSLGRDGLERVFLSVDEVEICDISSL